MQITAGSLMGTFGRSSRDMTEWMFEQRLVHFAATDAHGSRARRPLLQRAYQRIMELTDEATAIAVCCENPLAVTLGQDVSPEVEASPTTSRWGWFGRRSA